MGFNYDSLLQIAGPMSQFGGAMDPNGFGGRVSGPSYDATQAEIIRQEIERQKKAEEKAKKAKIGRTIGSTVGAVAGSLVPGIGNVAGAAIGSGLGGAVGSEVAGGDASMKAMMQDALMGGVGGYIGGKLPGADLGGGITNKTVGDVGAALMKYGGKSTLQQGIARYMPQVMPQLYGQGMARMAGPMVMMNPYAQQQQQDDYLSRLIMGGYLGGVY